MSRFYLLLSKLKQLDWIVIGTVFLLSILGLSAIYSTSSNYFYRQIIFTLIGLVLLITIALIVNYRYLKHYSLSLYIIMIIALSVVLISQPIRGVSGWFDFGFFALQPVEIAKLIIIIVLAKFFAGCVRFFYCWRFVLLSVLYLIIPAGLILFQPDLGSVMIIVFIWFGMALASGLTKKQLAILLLVLLVLFVFAWFFGLKSYQKNRLLVFLDPYRDPLGHGYNVIQSIIAVGSGQFLGKGLGFGSQSQLKFLPEQHTDFIFAAIAEELGFIGVLVMVLLFTVLFYRLFKIVSLAQDNFGRLLVLGVILFLSGHFIVNAGMNIGLLPVVGISLPFVSYGGSNLMASCLGIGLALSVKLNNPQHKGKLIDF